MPFVIAAIIGALLFGLFLRYLRRKAKSPPAAARFPEDLAFLFFACILGVTVGVLTGHSREAAIGAILPAVLTLIGGIIGFTYSKLNDDNKATVMIAAIAMVFFLFWGTFAGVRLRAPWEKYQKDFEVYKHQLEMQQIQYKHDLEMQRLEYQANLEKDRMKYESAINLYREQTNENKK